MTDAAKSIIAAVAKYNPPISKDSRLATVDPAYAGLPALPRVTFDGETALSPGTYQFIGDMPGKGDRVVMQPLGGSGGVWVIAGVVGGSTGLPKDMRCYTKGILAEIDAIPYTASPYAVCNVPLPDPGWPYRIMAGGQAFYQCDVDQAGEDFEFESRWDAVCVLDNVATGVAVSRQGIGRAGAFTQAPMTFMLSATVYTGVHTVYMVLIRRDGQQGLEFISAGGTGMTVFQVPA
jgi:hypothetical protein